MRNDDYLASSAYVASNEIYSDNSTVASQTVENHLPKETAHDVADHVEHAHSHANHSDTNHSDYNSSSYESGVIYDSSPSYDSGSSSSSSSDSGSSSGDSGGSSSSSSD